MNRLILSCIVLPLLASAHAQKVSCPDGPSHIVMESGSYSSQPGVSFSLHHFSATLVPRGKTDPMCFQKFTDVSHAEIFVSNESITRLFTKKLGATNSKIRDFKIQHEFGKVTMSGEITKVIPIKFSISGPISTDGTLLSMTATSVVADGIPVKPLLTMVGEHLSSMLPFKGMDGFTVDGNTLSFSPEKVAHLRGYITAVNATPQGLTLHYGRKPPRPLTTVPKA